MIEVTTLNGMVWGRIMEANVELRLILNYPVKLLYPFSQVKRIDTRHMTFAL